MAIDFPASPTNGQTFTSGSVTYTYDGTKWTALASGGGATDKIEEGNTSAEVIDTGSDGRFVVTTEGSERLRCDSSGRLLVGTSTARSNFNVGNDSAAIQVEGTGSSSSTISCVRNSNDAGTSALVLGHSRGSTVNGNTVLQSGDPIGAVIFEGADGTNFIRGARIDCAVDGTPGANDMPGRLVFSTTADGSATPVERMRITSNGDIGFGNNIDFANLPGDNSSTATGVAVDNGILKACRGQYAMQVGVNDTGAGKVLMQIFQNGTACGSITVSNSNATAYVTSSDYRLKEDVETINGAIENLNLLNPVSFAFKNNPGVLVHGFLAHEVQLVVPEAVTGTKDEVDANGKPVYQGIDQSKLVPLLTAALQEAIGRIETLEAKVAALEGV